jgi:hypothetical protein
VASSHRARSRMQRHFGSGGGNLEGGRQPVGVALEEDTSHLTGVTSATRHEGVLDTAKPWFLAYARVGYGAKGVVHLLMGVLALAAALGETGARVADAPGALRAVAHEPLGKPIVVVVGAGLLGYAVLRIVFGLFDPPRRGRSLRLFFIRIGEVASGVAYLLLVWGAIALASGLRPPPSGDVQARTLSQEAMRLPHGAWLIALAALIFAGVGIWLLARGLFVRNVCADLEVGRLGRRGSRVAAFFIRVGSVSQGTLFSWIGYLLFRAAAQQDPRQARGMDGVLKVLAGYGDGLLALMAAGVMAVGVSAFIEARWRRLV